MTQEPKKKVIVNILYPCYICANEYSGAKQVIIHVRSIHGYILNPREVGHHRPLDKHYEFENDIKKQWNVQHFGCPSCWFHCPTNFEDLMEHIMTEHKPLIEEGFVHKNRDEEDEIESEEEAQELDLISDEDEGDSAKDQGQPAKKDTAKEDTEAKKDDVTDDKKREPEKEPCKAEADPEDNVAEEILAKFHDLHLAVKSLFRQKD